MFVWDLKNKDGKVLAQSPTILAAIHTARAIFDNLKVGKDRNKIIVLYDEDGICATVTRRTKTTRE